MVQSPYYSRKQSQICELKLCEFNIILKGEAVFKDVVYAKTQDNKVIVKNVLGETREFNNCKITEVDVNSTRLVLTAVEA